LKAKVENDRQLNLMLNGFFFSTEARFITTIREILRVVTK